MTGTTSQEIKLFQLNKANRTLFVDEFALIHVQTYEESSTPFYT
jgi:hypothetical protein